MRFATGVTVAGTLALAVTLARGGDFIQLDLDGIVTQGGWTAGATIITGEPLHARLVYDVAVPDLDPSPRVGHYQYGLMDASSSSGSVFNSGPSAPGSVFGIYISSQPTYDEFRFDGALGLHDRSTVFVRFPSGTFANDSLPSTLPFAMTTDAQFAFSFVFSTFARGTFTRFSSSLVPEPTSSAIALPVALALFGCSGRRARYR